MKLFVCIEYSLKARNGNFSEKVIRNLYENLWLKISKIVLLKIFDHNCDAGVYQATIVDSVYYRFILTIYIFFNSSSSYGHTT